MLPNPATSRPLRVVRLKTLVQKIGISRSSIYNKLNPKSRYFDATFPKPISLGLSSVGWIESQIDSWIEMKCADSGAFT